MVSYRPRFPIRIVTAAALFDGHDAAINVIRRILQSGGAEVVHLGHNRGAEEVVDAAIQEDAQGICVSSYQGGHMEYFRYLRTLLAEKGAPGIRIFGGGGGVIVPREIRELHAAGIDRIFSPEDGRQLGLEGMIEVILKSCDFDPAADDTRDPARLEQLDPSDPARIARLITLAENGGGSPLIPGGRAGTTSTPVVGITGPGGAGKSSLTDELIVRLLAADPSMRIAVLAVDPSKRKTGGALLGDRIRMNSVRSPRVYFRSLATRRSGSEISSALDDAIAICRGAAFDLILVETAGIGQGNAEITRAADLSLYVMTSEYGAETQLEKIEMIDEAHLIALNKFERRGAVDALRDVRKQFRRARGWFGPEPTDEALPIFGTMASQFNDAGVTTLFERLWAELGARGFVRFAGALSGAVPRPKRQKAVIPPERVRYLSEIAEACRAHRAETEQRAARARSLYAITLTLERLGTPLPGRRVLTSDERATLIERGAPPALLDLHEETLGALGNEALAQLAEYEMLEETYRQPHLEYLVRDKSIRVPLFSPTLSGQQIPKVAPPRLSDWGDRLSFMNLENVPGRFPYTAGTFPLRRTSETPTRMFAGEGPPERTNERFHLLAAGQPTARLSTAFDSVTLYGEDPHERPDIYGKIGESGVSVATVEDAERLYAGFDLCAPETSVSMTINGPAPIVLALFMNTAYRQQVRRYLVREGRLALSEAETLRPDVERGQNFGTLERLLAPEESERLLEQSLRAVRGTVQADILKEDQAQNTCIFSTEFALRMMGDIQSYFVEHQVRNYYSVSISGYHIAEAGANPITQLGLTLANGFTYVQYYLSRGMAIDDFAPNLSFFFSNGLDAEYTVIGRVARRIWATAMRRLYGASERSQMLKYHVQTSGRSLHAMEIDFNDIRTTLQALMALEDNCNSLHTNAFDEALTTPTAASVRRAIAIQMIIDRELGLMKNENPLQGSYFIEALTDRVEAAVLEIFEQITERGGVLGAMETQYQRRRIQEESLEYERRKHDGTLPIIGVNTFQNLDADYERDADNVELRRASPEEKDRCITRLRDFWRRHEDSAPAALSDLKRAALSGSNIFGELMRTVRHASLGQISGALYEVGGAYRRNM